MKENQIQIHRIRRLSQALIVSITLNVILGVSFTYWIWKDSIALPIFDSKPAEYAQIQHSKRNRELLKQFKNLAFEQLISKLSFLHDEDNTALSQERPLALACLVAFHYFDLARALGESPKYIEKILTSNPNIDLLEYTIPFYSFTEDQYRKIINFAHSELWPLTNEGLFIKLQDQLKHAHDENKGNDFKKVDPKSNRNNVAFSTLRNSSEGKESIVALAEAFYLTPEYNSVESLFNRNFQNSSITKEELALMLCDGNWEMLSTFYENQKINFDISTEKQLQFLENYLVLNSISAAKIYKKIDQNFVQKDDSDPKIKKVKELLADEISNSVNKNLVRTDLSKKEENDIFKTNISSNEDYLKNRDLSTIQKTPPLVTTSIKKETGCYSSNNTMATLNTVKLNQKENKKNPRKSQGVNVATISKAPQEPVIDPKSIVTLKNDEKNVNQSIIVPKAVKPKVSTKSNETKAILPLKPVGKLIGKSIPSQRSGLSVNDAGAGSSAHFIASQKKERTHIVQEGESLWKISQKYHVDMNIIKQKNQLSTDALKPGTVLRIP